jgi:hypothetical protein
MKQFDDTLASVAGVGTKESLSSGRLSASLNLRRWLCVPKTLSELMT